MTYDNAGGAYFGTLSSASSTSPVVTTTHLRIPVNRTDGREGAGAGWVVEGGALIVLNGTGAGQIRRIVSAADNTGHEWILDAPLQHMEDSRDSFVQILPFRGRNIFHNNHLSDVGALQFYGIGLENVVSENKLERMAGLVSWGQWRGLVPRTASDREERSGGAQQGRVQVCRNSAASALIRMLIVSGITFIAVTMSEKPLIATSTVATTTLNVWCDENPQYEMCLIRRLAGARADGLRGQSKSVQCL